MVRIRRLTEEFTSPDEVVSGAILSMEYLSAYASFQRYLDGDLSPIVARMVGADATAQNVSGYRFYSKSGMQGLWANNYFRSVASSINGAVFEQMPVAIDSSPEVQKRWEAENRPIVRALRMGVEWLAAKGRAVWKVENQVRRGSVLPVFRAVDPAGYLPIIQRTARDQIVGHIILEWWWSQGRLPGGLTPDRVTADIIVTAEDAERSDGLLTPIAEKRTFTWAGEGQGVLGSLVSTTPSRTQGIWTVGDDDSVFADMESDAWEAIMAITNARTALTGHVRTPVILPGLIDTSNLGSDGTFTIDPLDPQIRVPPDSLGMGSAYGFVDPPGPQISAAFIALYEQALDNLAYHGLPEASVGRGFEANEAAASYRMERQPFLTRIGDIRDDLGGVMAEAWPLLGGPEGIIIGWEDPPQTDQAALDDRAIKLKGAGLVSTATAQAIAHVPVEEIAEAQEDQNGTGDQL